MEKAYRRSLRLFGLRVLEERGEYGITQEALAEKLGISRRQMQRIEAGAANISLLLVFALERALGVAAGRFFDPPDVTTRRRPGRPVKHDRAD